MITYHNPDNLRKLIIPNSLKQSEGIDNSASYYVNKSGTQMIAKVIDMSKIANKLLIMRGQLRRE